MQLDEAKKILCENGYTIINEDITTRKRLRLDDITQLAETIKMLTSQLPLIKRTYEVLNTKFGRSITDLHIELRPMVTTGDKATAYIQFKRGNKTFEIDEHSTGNPDRHDGAINIGTGNETPSFLAQWKTYEDLVRIVTNWS